MRRKSNIGRFGYEVRYELTYSLTQEREKMLELLIGEVRNQGNTASQFLRRVAWTDGVWIELSTPFEKVIKKKCFYVHVLYYVLAIFTDIQ